MATGGSLSRALQGGHEPFYDFNCSLCEKEGKHMEAVRYCEECFVYMCDSCVNYHNRFPLNSRHKLLDQSQFTTLNQPALKSFPTKRCLKHPGELINIFCEDHDVVCCSVCKALDHSSCTKTQHLPDAAKGVLLSQGYQSIKKQAKEFLSEVNNVLANLSADIFRIAKEKDNIKQTIANFRKKVNKYFDNLEQKSLDELDFREKRITTIIDKDLKFLHTTKTKAEDILKQIETFKGDNECELFVHVKMGKDYVHDSMGIVHGYSKSQREESIKFIINPEIEVYLSSLKKLGTFSKARLSSTSSEIQVAVPKQSPVSQSKRADTSKDTGYYQLELFGRYNVHEKSDSNDSFIRAICQLPDRNILIIDANNGSLKRLDPSYKLIDSIKINGFLYSVCAVGSDEVAVSLWTDKKIQIVSVGRRLSLRRTFSTGTYCRGMAYIDNKLYVCCGDVSDSSSGCIEVYNKAGKLKHRIFRAARHSSSVPDCIISSDDGQHLFVTMFRSDTITMLDFAGNVVNTYSDKKLKNPCGLCTYGRGHVFVCGKDSNTVHKITPENNKIEVILSESDDIKNPWGVCYDWKYSRLLVSCGESNELVVFNLK
ncbi:uncharacterized protein LOC123541820 [Mercenaria mercenaria]|uniref:uncharacterized protein LOC123541820 n=1 Tax=Mercenaria mercenaria TaxID=6596 RepID=UPI00234F54BC|nr:uncharacterized protein LOC123541820 [Mercenaria mercenaria]